MHPQQKHAWFNLIVISCALVPGVAGYCILYASSDPKAAVAAFAFFGIGGLLGFGPGFYRKRKGSPAVVADERDQDINRKATVVGWGVNWLIWGLFCMVPWFYVAFGVGLEQTAEPWIPVLWLPLVYMVMGLLHMAVWSIAVLVLYAKGAGDGGE